MRKPTLYRISVVTWDSHNHNFAVRYLRSGAHDRKVKELLCGDWPTDAQIALIQYLIAAHEPFVLCFGTLDAATEWFRLYCIGESPKLPPIQVTAGAR
jgi:hypothetical protein